MIMYRDAASWRLETGASIRHGNCHPTASDPVIHRIALVPVSAPAELSTDDRSLTRPFIQTHGYLSINDQRRQSVADQRMISIRDSLGAKLTSALQWALTAAGFETWSIESLKRLPNCLEAIDYKALPTLDPVLHVAFTEVGMASSLWSSDCYGPRVNVRSSLLAHPAATTWLTNDLFYYGSDSSGETTFSIPGDPRHRYANLDALIDNADQMPHVFEVAVQAIAERISNQLCARFGVESHRARVLA